MASTGQVEMHFTQPMQRASTITACCGGWVFKVCKMASESGDHGLQALQRL